MQFFVPSSDSCVFNGLLTYELFLRRPALYEAASVFSSPRETRTKVYRFMRKSVACCSMPPYCHHLAGPRIGPREYRLYGSPPLPFSSLLFSSRFRAPIEIVAILEYSHLTPTLRDYASDLPHRVFTALFLVSIFLEKFPLFLLCSFNAKYARLDPWYREARITSCCSGNNYAR